MSYSKEQLKNDLIKLGIKAGDKILIHSSFKSMGKIEGGAKTFFDALQEVVTADGTIVLPTLSYTPVYSTLEFNAKLTPSCVGYLSEYFRTEVEGVIRSIHPTHSCAVWGKDAEWFVKDHELDTTPVGKNSPFFKLGMVDGKILMLGCSCDHNTTLHGVEEAGSAPYVFDFSKSPVEYKITNLLGEILKMRVQRHNIGQSGYAQKYSRANLLLDENEIANGKILDADAVLMNSAAVWKKGLEKLKNNPYYFVDKVQK